MGAPKATDMPAAEAAERISRFFAIKSGMRFGNGTGNGTGKRRGIVSWRKLQSDRCGEENRRGILGKRKELIMKDKHTKGIIPSFVRNVGKNLIKKLAQQQAT